MCCPRPPSGYLKKCRLHRRSWRHSVQPDGIMRQPALRVPLRQFFFGNDSAVAFHIALLQIQIRVAGWVQFRLYRSGGFAII